MRWRRGGRRERGLRAAALLFCACQKPVEPPERPMPALQLHGVEMSSFRGSEQVASGTAAQLAYERSTADVTGSNARLVMLHTASNGAPPTATLTAPTVTGNLTTRSVNGAGGVQMDAANGTHATTARAHFDALRMTASGSDPVQVRAPRYSLDAVGFSLDLRTEEYTFFGPAKSSVGGLK